MTAGCAAVGLPTASMRYAAIAFAFTAITSAALAEGPPYAAISAVPNLPMDAAGLSCDVSAQLAMVEQEAAAAMMAAQATARRRGSSVAVTDAQGAAIEAATRMELLTCTQEPELRITTLVEEVDQRSTELNLALTDAFHAEEDRCPKINGFPVSGCSDAVRARFVAEARREANQILQEFSAAMSLSKEQLSKCAGDREAALKMAGEAGIPYAFMAQAEGLAAQSWSYPTMLLTIQERVCRIAVGTYTIFDLH